MKQPNRLFIALLAVAIFVPLRLFAANFNNPVDTEESSGTAYETDPYGALAQALNNLTTVGQNIETANGAAVTQTDVTGLTNPLGKKVTTIQGGVFNALNLKPSDRKRLQNIANGTADPNTIQYDQRLLDLLTKLVAPASVGGGGLTYLRVADLLRIKSDPRSTETEGATNISQHQNGKAADITEVGLAHCTATKGIGGIGGTRALAPFPVKVAWQGGANVSTGVLVGDSFDATSKMNAFAQIVGSQPPTNANSYRTTLTGTMQQLARRVIANELKLDLSAFDNSTSASFLSDIGREITNKNLGLSPGSLTGSTQNDRIRSVAQAELTQSLKLPAGSLNGNTWTDAINTLGHYKVASDTNIPLDQVLSGKFTAAQVSSQYHQDTQANQAFNLPSTINVDQLSPDNASAFRQIGANWLATTLRYDPQDTQAIIAGAGQGNVPAISFERSGVTPPLGNYLLTIIAPTAQSSKAAGELAAGNNILGVRSDANLSQTSTDLTNALKGVTNFTGSSISTSDIKSLISQSGGGYDKQMAAVGAKSLENIFGLPDSSLSTLVKNGTTVTLDNLTQILGQRALEDQLGANVGDYTNNFSLTTTSTKTLDADLNIPAGTTGQFQNRKINAGQFKKIIGQAVIANDIKPTVLDKYPLPEVGLGSLTNQDIVDILTGKQTDISARAGAAWVEEDLGLTPGTLVPLFANATNNEKLTNSGIAVLGGILDIFNINGQNITSTNMLLTRLGQARVEGYFGFDPGTFASSVATIKSTNAERWADTFANKANATDYDNILHLTAGSTANLVSGRMTVDQYNLAAGQAVTNDKSKINNASLSDLLGWDPPYNVNGNDLYKALAANNWAAVTPYLIKLGGYSNDQSFGYDPGTIQEWMNGGDVNGNQTLIRQGSHIFSGNLGLSNLNSLFDMYKTGKGANLDPSVFSDPGIASGIRATDISGLAKIAQSIGIPGLSSANPATQILIDLAKSNKTTPLGDLSGFLTGNFQTAMSSYIAGRQVDTWSEKGIQLDYGLMRIIDVGSASDPATELDLAKKAQNKLAQLVNDSSAGQYLANAQKMISLYTKGTIDATGHFDPNAVRFLIDQQTQVITNILAQNQAQKSYTYGILDGQLQKINPSVPSGFAESMFEGTDAERGTALASFVGGRILGNSGIDPSIVSAITTYVNNYKNGNYSVGQISATLQASAITAISNLVSQQLSSLLGNSIPPAAASAIANVINGGKFDPSSLKSIGVDLFAQTVDKLTGVSTGTMVAYYGEYKDIQSTISSYQSGAVSATDLAIKAATTLFGKEIAAVTNWVDNSLGLPNGTTQDAIAVVMTGGLNVLADLKLGYDLLFGERISCPDLTKTAQANVQNLIDKIITIGSADSSLLPSQIITLKPDYIKNLQDKIKEVYQPCLDVDGAMCGIFALPGYTRQVHIGF